MRPVRGPRRFAYAVLVLLILAAVVWLMATYQRFLDAPLDLPTQGLVYTVPPGASVHSVVRDLDRLGVAEWGWRWRLHTRLNPVTIQAGEYRLDHGLTPPGLLARLAGGDVITYRFTIVEGWTVRQLLAALREAPVLAQTLPTDEGPDWSAAIDADFEHPEGWFLPETYQFVRGDRDVDLLERAYEAMQEALDAAWDAREDGLPVDEPYDLLTLASIVEKETGVPEERAQVAGVLVRRLQRGMRLEVDPTVIYGMGDAYDGNIRRVDLQRDTPYNTYTRHGLPPTPIALPGRAALMATAQPADGDALYFVADGSGGHTFSATYEEHQRAVQRWVELQRQRRQQP